MAFSTIRLYFAAAFLTLVTNTASGQAFSLEPLRIPIAFPNDSLPDTWPSFNAWLRQHSASIPSEQLPRVQERLFAYISADAKQRTLSNRALIPARRDSLLVDLFEWADRLGVTGGGLVAQRLANSPVASPELVQTLPGFTIGFDSLYSLVAVEDGWRIQFPHYFMIGTTTRRVYGNGVETTIAVISTLFAADSTEIPGASQATIVVASGRASPAEMTAFWLGQLSIQPTETIQSPVSSALRVYRSRDAEAKMSKELVVFAPNGRTILVMYIGRDGTFEANRPHFIDVLNSLMVQ